MIITVPTFFEQVYPQEETGHGNSNCPLPFLQVLAHCTNIQELRDHPPDTRQSDVLNN